MKHTLRIGLVGTGSVVREIYQYLYLNSRYAPILDIVAAADPNAEMLGWFCDLAGMPPERRFESYQDMLDAVELDAVQVNTPDSFHREPTVYALERGLDVMLPKPLAASVADAHAIMDAARKAGRFVGVDFHKRSDPRIIEAAARYRSGRYGRFQLAVLYMMDKLLVADPNHRPMFFATDDFAEKNSPLSFLTVHVADALMTIVDEIPITVRATSFAHKLPTLAPRPVRGLDMVDVEVRFESGAVAHFITGWHLPNTAHGLTVQSGRIVCADGLIDLDQDVAGYREIHADGLAELNPLFRTFAKDGSVSGFGMDQPGQIFEQILAFQNEAMEKDVYKALMTPQSLGFYATLIVDAAERSLAAGRQVSDGVVAGIDVDAAGLVKETVGAEAAGAYGYE